jgi:hypothetical protein
MFAPRSPEHRPDEMSGSDSSQSSLFPPGVVSDIMDCRPLELGNTSQTVQPENMRGTDLYDGPESSPATQTVSSMLNCNAPLYTTNTYTRHKRMANDRPKQTPMITAIKPKSPDKIQMSLSASLPMLKRPGKSPRVFLKQPGLSVDRGVNL